MSILGHFNSQNWTFWTFYLTLPFFRGVQNGIFRTLKFTFGVRGSGALQQVGAIARFEAKIGLPPYMVCRLKRALTMPAFDLLLTYDWKTVGTRRACSCNEEPLLKATPRKRAEHCYTVSRVLFRKRQLTEFRGKLGGFCDKLGEFAKFGTPIIGWKELTELAAWNSVRAKKLTEFGVCWPRGSTGVQRYGCIPRSAANNLGQIPQKLGAPNPLFWRVFLGGGNTLGLVPASLPHALGYACTFYPPTSPPPSVWSRARPETVFGPSPNFRPPPTLGPNKRTARDVTRFSYTSLRIFGGYTFCLRCYFRCYPPTGKLYILYYPRILYVSAYLYIFENCWPHRIQYVCASVRILICTGWS